MNENTQKGGTVNALSLEETKTTDLNLAAALMSVGFKPLCPPFTVKRPNHPGSWQQFTFGAVSECGNYRAKNLVEYWRGGEVWIRQNSDHPFAYTMAALLQKVYLVDGIKRSEDVALVQRGKSVAMLPMNASLACEETILGQS